MNRKFFLLILVYGFIFSIISSCKKESIEVQLPVIITLDVNVTGPGSVISGGKITDDGGGLITERGVVWSKSQNPSIEIHEGKTLDGTGTGEFISHIHDLTPETEYFLRAFATNKLGTAYGQQISFLTLIADGTTGTVTYQGHTYGTVYIGGREWMAENLRNIKYRNGIDIPTDLFNEEWENTKSGAYAIYPHQDLTGLNSDAEVLDTYGALYNFYTVVDSRGLCPPGWKVPSDEDWMQLEMHMGMSETAANAIGFRGTGIGDRLKTGGETGFEGLMAGARTSLGSYQYAEGSGNEFGLFYTSTESDMQGFAFRRCLKKDDTRIGRYNTFPKSYGLSVRCVKEN